MTYHIPGGVSRAQHVAELAAKVTRLRAEGLSFATISRRLGLNPTTVSRLAKMAQPAPAVAR